MIRWQNRVSSRRRVRVSEGGLVHLRHELRPSNSVVDGTANGHRHEFELHVLRKYVLWSTIYV
jgi:hypothetical protein